MKKKRLLYLDYIRAFSTILIILTHYNALFLYLPQKYTGNSIILSAYVNNLYIGDWGVSLFLIISGAALMYTYQDNFNIKEFYKKRVLTIFPLYWFTYIITMSYLFLRHKTINPMGAARWKIFLSIIGMDAYLGGITDIWSCIGEWFLGLIIIIYIVFPAIFWLINKNEKLLWLVIMPCYLLFIKMNPLPLALSTNVFVRLPEFCFGMSFIKNREKIMNMTTVLLGGVILVIDHIYMAYIPVSVRTAYLGVILFLCFVFLSKYIEKIKIVNKISAYICKYSYIIFLIHHRIIWEVTANWDMSTITRGESWFLFFICMELIFLSAYLIKNVYSRICDFIIVR